MQNDRAALNFIGTYIFLCATSPFPYLAGFFNRPVYKIFWFIVSLVCILSALSNLSMLFTSKSCYVLNFWIPNSITISVHFYPCLVLCSKLMDTTKG